MDTNHYFCGFVALIGRPNVGKSTLINRLLGEKLCITSHKPQTTRHRIVGINTRDDAQIIYVDTPGLHQENKKAMNRIMNKTALNALHGVDLILFVVDPGYWGAEDDYALKCAIESGSPIALIVNKADMFKDKKQMLPLIAELSEKHDFISVFPISALRGDNTAELESFIVKQLPLSPPLYDQNQLTDRGMRFMVSELVREQVFKYCQQELPYETTVQIEDFVEEKELIRIAALIYVERDGQKKIVIGKGGANLKQIGTAARHEIEKVLEKKVFLQMWVKVKTGWVDDERMLQSLGYHDPLDEK